MTYGRERPVTVASLVADMTELNARWADDYEAARHEALREAISVVRREWGRGLVAVLDGLRGLAGCPGDGTPCPRCKELW